MLYYWTNHINQLGIIPMTHQNILKSSLLAIACTAYFQGGYSQETETQSETETPSESETRELETVVVVGTQIVGSDIAGALPVTILTSDDIEVTGAGSGGELLRSIPQAGDVIFGESEFAGINGARGDIGSINLRAIGTGNTLVLLNGRRLVLHPGTQVENFVPVVTVNSQSLPVTGIERLEVLRDGASAIYGTDAVAGVINTITQDDYEGYDVSLRYGTSDGIDLAELSGTLKYGVNFNDDRSNFSIFANFLSRDGFSALQRPYSATEDLRVYFVGTPFEGDIQLRNLASNTQWGEFTSLDGGITQVNNSTSFHIQPSTVSGCRHDLGNGVCADDGGSIDASLRLDRARYRDLVGDVERQNLMMFFNHQDENGTRYYGEFIYYSSDYNRQRETAQILSSGAFGIPANAHHNPFNKRLRVNDYRALDAGPRMTNVTNNTFRLLGGARFDWANWNVDTALLHSKAETVDTTNRMSTTLFQRAISRTDATAYNIFAGGNTSDIHAPSTFNSANNQATINSFIVPVFRKGETSITLVDFKLSDGTFREMAAGYMGLAFGFEFRQEEFTDDRDPRLDGTITFTDAVTNNVIGSDVVGSSPSPDTNGDRTVSSAFAELAVPLVNSDMNVDMVHRLDAQLAIRAENYSDVGGVIKPKVALSWFPHPEFQVRTAFSQGFRAPNLEQINANNIRRVNTNREDWIHCAAEAMAKNTAFSVRDCDGVSVESVRSGGPDLKPEENTNLSIGMVFQPASAENLVLTLDWWRVEQEDVVGLFSDQNQISLDYVLRLRGSSNPNVVREDPTTDQTTLFNQAKLTPAGDIKEVLDPYINLTPRQFEGIDLGLAWSQEYDQYGSFDVKFNAAYLSKANQDHSDDAKTIAAAIAAGTASNRVTLGGTGDRVKQNGRPEWRSSASLIWRKDVWGAGLFYNFVGEVIDTSVRGDAKGELFVVDSFQTISIYGQYTVEEWMGGDTRLRLGIRNIADQDPPIADEFASGYFPSLHSNRGRYIYFDVRRKF